MIDNYEKSNDNDHSKTFLCGSNSNDMNTSKIMLNKKIYFSEKCCIFAYHRIEQL